MKKRTTTKKKSNQSTSYNRSSNRKASSSYTAPKSSQKRTSGKGQRSAKTVVRSPQRGKSQFNLVPHPAGVVLRQEVHDSREVLQEEREKLFENSYLIEQT